VTIDPVRERDMAFADALDEGVRVLMRLSARLRALHVADTTPTRAQADATAAEVPRAHALGPRQLPFSAWAVSAIGWA
jgi:hypothetical protein